MAMILVDITHPKEALQQHQQQALADRIRHALASPGGAPEETLRRARTMLHIVFHEADTWSTGDGPLPADTAPPYLVTVTVPEAWRAEISQAMGILRAALKHQDAQMGVTERTSGDVWINVVGVEDGSIGLDGRPVTANDVLMELTADYRTAQHEDTDTPDGTVTDPICGMQVRLTPAAITLDHDGTVKGFCSQGCRHAYAQLHGLAI